MAMQKKWGLWMLMAAFLGAAVGTAQASGLMGDENKLGKLTEGASSDQSVLASSEASPFKRHSFGVGIGETFLTGDFAEYGDDDITTDFFYEYKASYSFELMVNAHQSNHEIGQYKVRTQGVAVGIKADFFHFDSFSPFAVAGVGFYRPKVTWDKDGPLETSESKTAFGIHFGGGGDLQLNNNFIVGLLAHYHNPFDVKQKTGSNVEGSYLKLLLTLKYAL